MEPGVLELLGPGRMVYITPDTEVAAGTTLSPGYKVLATLSGTRDAEGRELVAGVRALGPAPKDVAEFTRVLAQLASVDLPLVFEPSATEWLDKRFSHALLRGEMADHVPLRAAISQWEQQDRRFGMMSWLEDLGPGLHELSEHLVRQGLTSDLDPAPLEAEFDRLHSTLDDEELVRRHLIGRLVSLANERSAAAGRPERFFAFADLQWEDEPLWLWLTPVQAEALVKYKLLKLPKDPERAYDPRR